MPIDEQAFFVERRALKDKSKKDIGFKIIATDISQDAIDVSQKNAKTAGVEHLIEFSVCDFEETDVPEEPGVVMFNPEYGERLGVHSKLEATYARIGDFMKKECQGYRGYIFTGNPDLAKKIGLKASRKTEFYNGKLDCRLLEYELYSGSRREMNGATSVPKIPAAITEPKMPRMPISGMLAMVSIGPTEAKVTPIITGRRMPVPQMP